MVIVPLGPQRQAKELRIRGFGFEAWVLGLGFRGVLFGV